MFGFFGFLLVLFLLILFIGFAILGNIMRVLFGLGRRNTTNQQNRTYTHQSQNTYQQSNQTDNGTEDYAETSSSASEKHSRSSAGQKRKIFDDEDGEYVDYEEVK